MRLIDADALMMDLEKWMKQVDPTHPQEDNAIPPLEDIIVSTLMTIEEQPTVDAIKVIRCKDCRFFHENVFGDEIGMGRPYGCLIVGHCCCEFWGRKGDGSMSQTSPEGFCSFGERRSE